MSLIAALWLTAVRVLVLQDGAAAPDVAVSLGNDVEHTGADGVAWFPHVESGVYGLTAGELTQEVVVSAELESFVLALDRPRAPALPFGRSVLTRDALRRLPHASTVSTVLETLEPMSVTDRIDVAGIESDVSPLWSVRGSSFTQNRVSFDGADVTDPAGGGPLVYPDIELFEEVTLQTTRSSGTELLLVTRPMPPSFRGSAALRYTGSPLQTRRPDAASPELVRYPGARLEVATPRIYAAAHGFDLATGEGETSLTAGTLKIDLAGTKFLGTLQRFGEEQNALVQARWRDTRVSYARSRIEPASAVSSDTTRELTSTPSPPIVTDGTRERLHVTTSRRWLSRSHYLRANAEFSRAAQNLTERAPPLERLVVDGKPHAVAEYLEADESRITVDRFGLAAEDTIFLGRWRLDPSVRLDVSRSDAIRWTSLSGRLAGRFAIGASTVAHGSLGRHPHFLTSRVTAAAEQSVSWVWRSWMDRNGDSKVDEDEIGAPLRRGGAWVTSLDRDLPRPYTHEITFGIERRFRHGFFRADAYQRWDRRLIERTNVGIAPSSYESFTVPDVGIDGVPGTEDDLELTVYDQKRQHGEDAFLVTHPGGHTSFSQGAEMILGFDHGRFAWRLSGRAYRDVGKAGVGNDARENDTGVLGGLFDDPNQATNAEGRLFFDRAFTGKLAATVDAPWDLAVGAAVRYWDGQPFARQTFFSELGQGFTVVQVLPRGRQRFAFNMTVDVRVERSFTVGALQLDLAVDAFNLFNQARETGEVVRSGELFRDTTTVQAATTVVLGARLRF